MQGEFVRRIALLGLAAVVSFTAHPVRAQSVTAAQVASDSHQGAYIWVDGVYERVGLPTYGLTGYRSLTSAGFDAGPSQSFNPRLDAGGVRGAIGTAVPHSNVRIELGGSYMDGGSTNSTALGPSQSIAGILMDGTILSGMMLPCIPGSLDCSKSATLRTEYRAWSLNAKAAADFRLGSAVVTPSVAVFGGITRADQTLSEAVAQQSFASGTYAASTSLQWRDIGVRGGLQLRSFVTPSFIVGWSGSVGVAARKIEFSGSDVATSSNPAFLLAGASTLTLQDSRTALLANAEANVTWHLTQAITLKGFAGLNYDRDVPGIAGAFSTGTTAGPTQPASLFFDSRTNLYAGGGVTVKFAAARP